MAGYIPAHKWFINEDMLALKAPDGKILVPSAHEIYAAEFKPFASEGILKDAGPPSAVFSELNFSKFPLQLSINVTVGSSSECNVVVKRSEVFCEVKEVFKREADHIIVDNTWYPFVKGTLEETRELLSSAEIDGTGRINLSQYMALLKAGSELVEVKYEEGSSGESFANEYDPEYTALPSLKCSLYPYQETGASWLRMIASEGLGCILGDEMGLGKTLQVIALVVSQISEGKDNVLIIAPATLLENWRREFLKFAPATRTLVHRGAERAAFKSDLMSTQVVITSYDTVIRDMPLFKAVEWDLVALDEAQAIKNPEAKRTGYVKQLPRRCAVAITGTPVENRLTDLWSIMDFVLPGYLGSRSEFEHRFEDTPEDAAWLEPLVTPVMLRRKVADVAKDLPERIDVPQVVELGPAAASQYDELRREIFDKYGAQATLVSLTKLRMFCTHPNLIVEQVSDPAVVSTKYQRLLEILEEIFSCNEKVLIFSSYSEMIDLVLSDVQKRFSGIYCDWIDGRVDVPERQPKVDRFSEAKGAGFLVLNPRAAGTGLNITAANHVIHYNLEWNPAIEDQASARAYRRGQEKPVTVHRLYFADTVEEVINDRVERKRELVQSAIVGTGGESDDYEDIVRALSVTPSTKGGG